MSLIRVLRSPFEGPARAMPDRVARMVLPVLLLGVAIQLVLKLAAAPPFVDYLVMWTGGRMAGAGHAMTLYTDPAAVDAAQRWLLGGHAHDRPFPYPPTSLFVFQPLAALPFWVSAVVWTLLIVCPFCFVVSRLTRSHRWLVMAMVLLAPGAIWAILSGQCVFLTGGLAIAGATQLERRPILAGVLLGAAAAFKPTVLLMAPLALMGGGHWRSLVSAGLAGLALVGLSALVWGAPLWFAWFDYAPRYLAAITGNPDYVTAIVAPAGLAARLGLEGPMLFLWRAGFVGAGAIAAFLIFRRTRALWPRLTALFGASLIATPYAMNYEMTLLLPGAVLALLTVTSAQARLLAFGAYWALAFAGLPQIGPLAVFVYLALALACGRAAEAEDEPPVGPEPVAA